MASARWRAYLCSVLFASLSLPALASFKLITVGLGLLLLLGVLTLVTRRWTKGRAEAHGLERVVRLDAQHALWVVDIDGQRMVVGTGSGGSPRLVCRLPRRNAARSQAARGPLLMPVAREQTREFHSFRLVRAGERRRAAGDVHGG